MGQSHRIEITYKEEDTRAQVRLKKIQSLGYQIDSVFITDVFYTNHNFTKSGLNKIANSLHNPIIQTFTIEEPINSKDDFDWAIEIGFLPGVTDNAGHTAKETAEDLLKIKLEMEESIFSSQITLIKGELNKEQVMEIAKELHNPLIQRATIMQKGETLETIIPLVHLEGSPKANEISLLGATDEELTLIGKEGTLNEDGTRNGPLAITLELMKVIQSYFKEIEKRNPTDIELESLAQTWSEHCKHNIFASQIDDIKDGLYKHYIKRATNDIRKKLGKDDFCVSVFSDNSGAIKFDENYLVTDKCETHNSPSALDPFGGAITGIVGVNRDTLGFGKGAKPILNRYGFCLGMPSDKEPIYRNKEKTQKMLSPKRIMEGVVEGVGAGGNCSGIPTPQGFLYFHKDYKGKPLVFAGTVGLIPKEVAGKPSHEKQAQPGNKIVVIGGRVGQDGIHGATFSSESLNKGSPATAVQIGDPYTQKKLSDTIIREARDRNLYTSITDCGAGGISCSVAEMAKECGGCEVELDKVPLKYPGLEPWKIWISESQERMTFAVPSEKLNEFLSLMEKREVEASVIGTYTDSGRCVVKYNNETIMDMQMDFLHEGIPQFILQTDLTENVINNINKLGNQQAPPKLTEAENNNFPEPHHQFLKEIMLKLISHPNHSSTEFVSTQYDHNVLGGITIGPLQGRGRVNGTATVTRPLLNSKKAVIASQSLYPNFSDTDAYDMAACSIDTVVRQTLAAGGSLKEIALMDNFCWCSSNDPHRLGQLKKAAEACYDYAITYGTPYISGKDSMFNDFKGFDKEGNPIKISAPPTLLVSSLGVMEDVNKCITIDPKIPGDLVYIIGETKSEVFQPELYTPQVDAKESLKTYQAFEKANAKELIVSAFAIAHDGLSIALMKSCIAGQLGMEIALNKIPRSEHAERDDILLFSETQSRFLVTINPKNKEEFEKIMKNISHSEIGTVTEDPTLNITSLNGKPLLSLSVQDLTTAYRTTFKNY